MEGYGRGGRGAALLQALKDKNSRGLQMTPGEREEGRSLGRGVFSSSISHGTLPPDQKGPMSTPISSTVSKPAGRGLAAMQALLEASRAKESSLSSVSHQSNIASLGRSRGLALAAASATYPSPSPSPIRGSKRETLLGGSTETDSGRSTLSPHSTTPDFHPAKESDSQNILRKQFQKIDIEPHAQKKRDGKPMALSANYIKIACKNEGVYQYHVSFSPEIDSKSMRYAMLYDHVEVTGKTRAFDGAILYLPIKLQNTETTLTATRLTDGVIITITVKLVKVLKPECCTTLYNIIFRRIMSILQMKQVGRYYYNPNTPTAIPQHKLEIWPGYITSIQEHDGGLMLMADASHKVLRKETVLDVMFSLHKKDPVKFKEESMKTIIGSVVLTWYNNKTYRIDDISWDMTPTHTFQSSTGESISFVDYYKKQYGQEIRDTDQPLLLHKLKKKVLTPGGDVGKSELICLIPEFCFMTGLTDDMRSDFRVMKDIAAHTRVTPMQRQLTLQKFVGSIKSTSEAREQLENWGLLLEEGTINLEGRCYQPEKIFMQGKEFLASNEADWGRDLTRAAVITPVALRSWVVLTCRQDVGKSKDFISMMMKVTGPMGIEVSNPRTIETRDNRTETLIRLLRETINSKLQLVVVIFPTSRDDKYSAVKKLCCVECPIPSQVIIARTISQQQKLRSVTQKIALQINCKLGGDLWAVDIPMRNLMVVGIDVYHDSSKSQRSIGAFVASTNHTFTRWFSRVCFQQPQQELIDGLKVCLISALTKYHELNHSLPRHIVVFRDGVSDSQLSVVSGYEVEQLSKCFSHFGDSYSPLLTVIIVQKRVNTRIFVNKRNIMENPPPGTIVDRTITRKQKYDFFLVSQHVRQGTVTPTHYVVVHDSSDMQVNHLQRLTYKMTHLYYNWPGTIRVPAPCQYAHKLAYLVGQSIHKEPAQQLGDRLYFL